MVFLSGPACVIMWYRGGGGQGPRLCCRAILTQSGICLGIRESCLELVWGLGKVVWILSGAWVGVVWSLCGLWGHTVWCLSGTQERCLELVWSLGKVVWTPYVDTGKLSGVVW